MASISTSSIENKHKYDFSDDDKDHTLFTLPFSEQDVLNLQKIFVSFGIHSIKTKNIIEGRQVIQKILNSLNYYHNIGCISELKSIPVSVCDIISHIELQKSRKGNLLVDLEDFLTIHPCFDFIWIEFTQDMQKQYALQDIKNIFEMYHVEERMSVLIVTYEN